MRATAIVLVVALAAAVAAAQKPPTAQQRKAAKAHFQQGRAFYDTGAWPDAVREYEKAFALVPLPELLFNIGQAWRMQGDKPQAIAAYRRYLDRLPDGPLADEARNHVASLTLKIQLEEAEAARKRAAEGEAAARRQAAEAEAARKRAEAEAAVRVQTRQEDEARLRRVAVEEAERMRREKEAAVAEKAAAQAAREEAGRTGRGLRVGGWISLVLGTISVGCAIAAGQAVISNYDEVKQFNENPSLPWSSDFDNRADSARNMQKLVLGLSIGGGVLVAGGISMLILAAVQRSRAYERLGPRLTLIPAVGPGSGALVLAGGF